MNKIDSLIAEYCKNGVAFKPLKHIGKRNQGIAITAGQMKILHKDNAPVRIFAAGHTIADVNYNDIPQDSIITVPSIIIKSRGNIGFEYYEKPFSHKNEMWSYSINDAIANQKFVFYYLLTLTETLQKLARSKSVKLPQLAIPDTDKIQIPLPPLPIQHEIVKILDSFTRLEAELEAELEARKKQYEYYRNKLLNFDKNITWKMLGDVANVQRGKRLVKSQLEKIGKYAVYQNSMIPLGYYHESNVKSDTTFVISAGAAGEIGHSKLDFWAADDVYFLTDSESVMSKYLYYCLLVQQNKILGQVRRASIPRLSRAVIEKLTIPVPSVSEQERIVTILDKFDALVNDISEGLPAEIKARRSQYEYYRNKLLTFKEAA